jgi:hypothetical protein
MGNFRNDPLDFWKVGKDRLEATAILVEAVDVGSLAAASQKINVPLFRQSVGRSRIWKRISGLDCLLAQLAN